LKEWHETFEKKVENKDGTEAEQLQRLHEAQGSAKGLTAKINAQLEKLTKESKENRDVARTHESKEDQESKKDQDVAELRSTMEKLGDRIEGLYTRGGPLASSKMVPELKEWHETFEKKVENKDGTEAEQLQRLHEAQDSVKGLTAKINAQQEKLTQESKEEQESLLLGVLMTRKDKPFKEQLSVLVSQDFHLLPQVAILEAIKSKGDFKTPLVEQVASYLDSHREKPAHAAPVAEDKKTKSEPKGRAAIASSLRKKLQKFHEDAKVRRHGAQVQLEVMEKAAKNHMGDDPKLAKKFLFVKKMEEKQFEAADKMGAREESALAKAAAAVEAGDLKKAMNAQKELQQLLEEHKHGSKNKFLVLMDMVSGSKDKDCPYCVAKCVEKCHNAGKPYVSCLTDCADAKAPPA